MPIVSKEQLENAAEDCSSLEDVVNGAANLNGTGTTTTRLGAVLKTIAKVFEEITTTGTGWLSLAQDWATKTTGEVETGEGHSSKAWAVGGTGVDNTAGAGSAKDWASKPSGTVDGTEYSAKKYAGDASASAAAAALVAAAMPFRDSITLTFADSPFTLTSTHRGYYVGVDTTGGNVVINMPQGSSVGEPYFVRIAKETGDANTITTNRAGSDTFADGSTNKVIATLGGLDFQLETSPTPDIWKFSQFGAGVGEEKRQVFVTTTDFTPGSTTTLTLTNTPIAATSTGLDLVFDGITQLSTEWSYSPSTGVITFSSAIPLGTEKVEARWRTALAVGVTGDGTVSWLKLASGIIASVSDMLAGTANYIISAANLKTFMDTHLWRKLYDTAQTLTGVASRNFTVPSWCNEIELFFDTVGTGSSSVYPAVRIGTGGTPATTGYSGSGSNFSAGVNTGAETTQAHIYNNIGGAPAVSGTMKLQRMTGNQWVITGVFGSGSSVGYVTGAVITLGGVADVVQVRTSTGANFSSGTVNALFKG